MEILPIRSKVIAPYILMTERTLIGSSTVATFNLVVADPMKKNLNKEEMFTLRAMLGTAVKQASPGTIVSIHYNEDFTGLKFQAVFRTGLVENQATYYFLEVLREGLLNASRMEEVPFDREVLAYTGGADLQVGKKLIADLIQKFGAIRQVFKDPADEGNIKNLPNEIHEFHEVEKAISSVLRHHEGQLNHPAVIDQIKADVSGVLDALAFNVSLADVFRDENGDIILQTFPDIMHGSVLPQAFGEDGVEEFRVQVTDMESDPKHDLPKFVTLTRTNADGSVVSSDYRRK